MFIGFVVSFSKFSTLGGVEKAIGILTCNESLLTTKPRICLTKRRRWNQGNDEVLAEISTDEIRGAFYVYSTMRILLNFVRVEVGYSNAHTTTLARSF